MKNDRQSVFGVVPERKDAPAPPGERQVPARAARTTAAEAARRQPVDAGAPANPPVVPAPTIAAGYASRAPASTALVDVEYRGNFPQEIDPAAVRTPNREIFARLLYVREVGAEDQRNGAEARIALLRDAFDADRRFPSLRPVLAAVETECWTWWHEVATAPVRIAPGARPQR